MKSNNKGFSLIELIVAVLIMGIVAGGAIYAFNVVHNARTSSAASVLANVLRQSRQKAMAVTNTTDADGVSSVYLHIYTSDGQVYADLFKGSTEKLVSEKIGNDTIQIALRKADVTNPSTILGTAVIGEIGDTDAKIYFKKSSGAISKITVGSADKSDMNELYITGLGEDQKVVLVKATGRAYFVE